VSNQEQKEKKTGKQSRRGFFKTVAALTVVSNVKASPTVIAPVSVPGPVDDLSISYSGTSSISPSPEPFE
jgi:hypothetical protein